MCRRLRPGVRPAVWRPSHVTRSRTADSVSPTRTTSPGASRCGALEPPMPFTKVPFVEPSSSTQTPSARGSNRACRAEAYSSPLSSRSLFAARPTVSAGASSGAALAGAERRAADDDEAAAAASVQAGEAACRARAPSTRSRATQLSPPDVVELAARGAHDAPDEEVEQHEEGDLEDEQQLVDRDRVRDDHAARLA